tara:strand:- start:578 stop:844 length:267 start_codon:yes stop_codon:yes gene_type:complete
MWFNILKKTQRWHKYIDDIMLDKTTRTAREIHGMLFDFMHSADNDGRKRTGRGVPDTNQIGAYLSSNPKYVKLERSQDKNKWRMADVV